MDAPDNIRRQLLASIHASPFHAPFQTLLQECITEGPFDPIPHDAEEAERKVNQANALTVGQYAAANGQNPADPEVVQQHGVYMAIHQNIDEAQRLYKELVTSSLVLLSSVRPLVPNESEERLRRANAPFVNAKMQINELFVPAGGAAATPQSVMGNNVELPVNAAGLRGMSLSGLVPGAANMSSSSTPVAGNKHSRSHKASHSGGTKKHKASKKSKSSGGGGGGGGGGVSSGGGGGGDSGNEAKKGKKKRGTLPKEAVSVLRKWLFDHFVHPYPTEEDKIVLARETGLSTTQVNYWFINARVRIWRPMIEKMDNKGTEQQ